MAPRAGDGNLRTSPRSRIARGGESTPDTVGLARAAETAIAEYSWRGVENRSAVRSGAAASPINGDIDTVRRDGGADVG